MSGTAYRIAQTYLFLGLILAGCNQTKEAPQSATPPPGPTPPQAARPVTPQAQPLNLYTVPLNPSDFSMQAIQENKKKAQDSPDNAQSLVGLGDANFMIQRYEVARDYYEQAIKIDPNHTNANLSLSNCYLFLQRSDDALQQLDKLLAGQKDNPEALYNKGLILLKSKQNPAAAKEAWTLLTQAHPDHPLAQRVKPEFEHWPE